MPAGLSEAALPPPLPDEEPADGTGAHDPSAAERVLACLSAAPASLDEIVRHTGLPVGAVQLAVLELELAGRIERHAGGRLSLIV